MLSTVPTTSPLTLTIEEAAAIIGFGRTKAYQMARAGKFPVTVHKIGGRYVIPARAVAEYLEVPLFTLQAKIEQLREAA